MKRIIMLATVVLAIAGCSEDLPDRTGTAGSSDIVGFTIGHATRGTLVTDASEMVDIGTFGYHTRQRGWTVNDLPDLMFNQRIYRDGMDWKYDGDPVAWNGEMVNDLFTFFAYAPYATGGNGGNGITVNADNSTGGIPTLTYTVPEDVAAQPDLMVAVPRKDIVRPASGYVSLDMRHALTAIGFEVAGNGERITRLSISGVSATGTLQMDGSNIAWTDLGSHTETDFTALINFDENQDYYTTTTTSTDIMRENGYLMMIPQTIDEGALLTVTYDDDTTLDIDIEPHEWLPGNRIIYDLTIVSEGSVILIEPSRITLPYVESHSGIMVDCSDGRGNQDSSLAWTLTSSESWLQLSLDIYGTNIGQTISGTGSQTVYVFAPRNMTGANRTANITLDGTENVVTVVEQQYTAAQRFARSNIVMYIDGNGNKILTFAEVEADHTTGKNVTYYDAVTSSTVTDTVPAIPANVQGLHFRWGSLVGITSDGNSGTAFNNGTTGLPPSHVVFWPAEYAPNVPASWVFDNSGASTSRQVPYTGGMEIWPGMQDAFDGYPNGAGPGFDKASAKGDICRYISDMGWVQGRWRMPTTGEIRELLAETQGFYVNDGKIIGTWDTNYERITNTGVGSKYGYYQIPDVRVVGSAVTGSENLDNSIPNPGFAKVVFPASGYRANNNGSLSAQGNYGFHWSATPSGGDFALTLDYHDYTNHPANNFGRANGYSVRCIMAE